MEPYYQDDLVTLYHADCLSHPELWADADVMVSDPPYGIDYNSGSPREKLAKSIAGDKDTAARDGALAFWGDRPALMFGTWRIPRPAQTRALLIWDTKGALGMGDLSIPWKPSHQEVYVLGRGFTGRRSTDVLTYPPVQSTAKNGRLHPHEKPIPLMRDLIGKCPPGTIVDPFSGSGSTLVAARDLGRTVIGFEVDERYCEITARRFDQALLPI